MAVEKKFVLVVVGPTAVGKTQLAVQLARHLKTEIVSADARQVFREMAIGTARPTEQEMGGIAHHLMGSHSIEADFNAGTFETLATQALYQVFEERNVAIICGGSGLYVQALLEGFDVMPPIPQAVREQIGAEYAAKGLFWLQNEVKLADPEYYAVADVQNKQRLMRALELYRATGVPASAYRKNQKKIFPWPVLKIGLELGRAELYARINNRVENMMTNGLLNEARQLFPQRHLNALQTVGYRELFNYFDGKISETEAVALIKQNTRHYAKRQLTWFKRDDGIKWFSPLQVSEILLYVEDSRERFAST